MTVRKVRWSIPLKKKKSIEQQEKLEVAELIFEFADEKGETIRHELQSVCFEGSSDRSRDRLDFSHSLSCN